jgi:hypothetical protein
MANPSSWLSAFFESAFFEPEFRLGWDKSAKSSRPCICEDCAEALGDFCLAPEAAGPAPGTDGFKHKKRVQDCCARG